MIINIPEIEKDLLKIKEKEEEYPTGLAWQNLATYIGIKMLESRIEQELNQIPLSVIDIEIAALRKG